MAQLTVQSASQSGAALATVSASAGGDTFVNNGNTILYFNNTNGAPWNVTIGGSRTCDQGQAHSLVVTVPASGNQIVGPFPPSVFGRVVTLTYGGVVGLVVCPVSLAG